jgi:septum formation inhibitor MinC
VLRTDTGNFNRFLTSLGLVLLLGALLVPYFFFHDTETLRISAHEFKTLTPVAREALSSRQKRERDLEVPVLVFALALAMGGAGSLYFGGRRLRLAQVKEDEAVDRQARKDDFEIQQMSNSEVEEKRDEQARESVQAEASRQRESPAGPEVQPQKLRAPTIEETRKEMRRIEGQIREMFEAAEFPAHEFLYEVKTVRSGQQVRLDGLFRSRNRDGTDVILTLKVGRQGRMIRSLVRNYTDDALGRLTRYRLLSKRQATSWLVIVVPNDVPALELEDRRRLEDQVNASLLGAGLGTIIGEAEVASLPKKFEQLFEIQAK